MIEIICLTWIFRMVQGRQMAPRAMLANARPSENPGKLGSCALAWRRLLTAFAACQARRAPVAPAGLASSLELKSSRGEARARAVGGALPPSPLRARRSDSPEVAAGPAALVFIVFHCVRAKGWRQRSARLCAALHAGVDALCAAPAKQLHARFAAPPPHGR